MRGKLLFILGFAVTVLGIALVISRWEDLVVIVVALSGPVIAVIGLVMMFAASFKR